MPKLLTPTFFITALSSLVISESASLSLKLQPIKVWNLTYYNLLPDTFCVILITTHINIFIFRVIFLLLLLDISAPLHHNQIFAHGHDGELLGYSQLLSCPGLYHDWLCYHVQIRHQPLTPAPPPPPVTAAHSWPGSGSSSSSSNMWSGQANIIMSCHDIFSLNRAWYWIFSTF